MKVFRICLAVFAMFSAVRACGQNGPTQPNVKLTWVQSTSPGITKNCIYRGATSGSYTLPGSCIPAGTTYTDTTPSPATTYWYAVTAQDGSGIESAYSTPVQVAVPASPNAPSNLNAPLVTQSKPDINVHAQVMWVLAHHQEPKKP